MHQFPESDAYTPEVAPVLVICATHVLLGLSGHWVMRLVAGPARADRFARHPGLAAECAASADPSHDSGSCADKPVEDGLSQDGVATEPTDPAKSPDNESTG